MVASTNDAAGEAVPRARRICRCCLYAMEGLSEAPERMVCVNQLEQPGRLCPVEASGTCERFRPRPRKAVRVAPPEPPSDEIRYIALTQGKFAIVDAGDYEWLSQKKWHIAKGHTPKCYAAAYGKGRRTILMHRLIMEPPEGLVVDHIDGNGLNNRRGNLRVCTQRQNLWNHPGRGGASRFKGVSFDRKRGKWQVRIRVGGRHRHLGYFDDEIEAAFAYDLAAVELMGEFAYLNFPRITGATRQAARRGVRSDSHDPPLGSR